MELPEQLKAVFSSPQSVDEDTNIHEDIEPQEENLEPPRRAEVDVDSLIRQRDAIIAEKQRFVEENRRLFSYAKFLEDEKKKLESPKEEVPELKKDPVGYIRYENKQETEALRSELNQLKEIFSNKSRELDSEKFQRTIIERVASDESNFKARAPDYDSAMQHLDAHLTSYLKSTGLTDYEAAQGAHIFKAKLFEDCLSMGLPMAETFYKHSLQAGYKPGVDPRISKSKKGVEAGSVLSSSSRGATPARAGEGRITLEQYQNLPAYDPIRMSVANDKALFSKLVSDGEVNIG